MTFKVNQKFEMRGDKYEITGTHKRSFLYKKENESVEYIGTAAKLNSMITGVRAVRKTGTKYINLYLKEVNMFCEFFTKKRTPKTIPKTKKECVEMVNDIEAALSPENISCDGERSGYEVRRSSTLYHNALDELKVLKEKLNK